MANEFKHQWRVTKYNPDNRDENGSYTRDEWTCPSEIGKTINRKVFMLPEYLQIEQAYIETIMQFLQECNVQSVRMFGVEEREIEASILYEESFSDVRWKEDSIVDQSDIPILCRMILRNFAYCRLEAMKQIYIHFGWDYYMYIGTAQLTPKSIEYARQNGLYAESYESPYNIAEEDVIRMIQWSDINGEVVEGEEIIHSISKEAYQQIFQLSEEPNNRLLSAYCSSERHFSALLKASDGLQQK
ncbi:hypothetical protein [Cytobacillus purgationiresistens]|uniref:Uncharacterized protein n=1 Tax=Cytobacillus purgationiresistens TaxID=863449 RepID=A0ABU0AHR9_9BACI|nr:hypothetical protein [Cytobacillus purgationiresistens]MDQ0270600.1 hypothetical protein [Cytobacillus purgationiresistens]